MEKEPHFENPYGPLIGTHVLTYIQEKDAKNKDMAVFVRGKILDVLEDGFKIEYQGNDNLLFDGKVEVIPIEYILSRPPQEGEPDNQPIFLVEENGDRFLDQNGKVVEPGKWIEINDED
ncbi:MAG: hypothetical protein M3Q73_00850 [bacterium]|nr:hypothetical protein [bacterium]